MDQHTDLDDGLSCKNCKSRDFSDENSDKVCTNCGDVQEEFTNEANLCSMPDNEALIDNFRNKDYEAHSRLNPRIRGETNNSETKRKICQQKTINDMRNIIKKLIKNPRAVDETMDLISSAFKAHDGRLINSKKFGIVGACIYYQSAKHQLGLSLVDICKELNVKLKVINVCLKKVKQLCPNFEYERPNIKDLVSRIIDDLSNKNYDTSLLLPQTDDYQEIKQSIPIIEPKDRTVLQDRVMLLIELYEAMHPYTQPTPQSLITAVVYHAWRSLDTFKCIAGNLKNNLNWLSNQSSSTPTSVKNAEDTSSQRSLVKRSISYEKFCQICELKYSSNGHKIVNKLQSSLLLLGRHLGDVNKINLPWYLKDIIENSPLLIREHRTDQNIK